MKPRTRVWVDRTPKRLSLSHCLRPSSASEVKLLEDGAAGLLGGWGVHGAIRGPEPHVVWVLVLAVAGAVAEGRAEGVDGPVAGRLVAGTQPCVVLLTLARVPAGDGRTGFRRPLVTGRGSRQSVVQGKDYKVK